MLTCYSLQPVEKQREQRLIDTAIAEYKAKGKEIKYCPAGQSGNPVMTTAFDDREIAA